MLRGTVRSSYGCSDGEPIAEFPHEALHTPRGAKDAASHDREHDRIHAVREALWTILHRASRRWPGRRTQAVPVYI